MVVEILTRTEKRQLRVNEVCMNQKELVCTGVEQSANRRIRGGAGSSEILLPGWCNWVVTNVECFVVTELPDGAGCSLDIVSVYSRKYSLVLA